MRLVSRLRNPGILLVTTLLIITFLSALSLAFIFVNRDNLVFAQRSNESESALQAAYSGLHYAMMRFEEDQQFGVPPPLSGPGGCTTTPNTSPGAKDDPFPDGAPGGSGGRYWSGGGSVVAYDSSLIVVETGATVVGVLGPDSHFQIHFNHFGACTCPTDTPTFGSYLNNGFDDSTISTSGTTSWKHKPLTPQLHSTNNLNSSTSITVGGKIIPPYSAHIVAIGYSHGTTRVVEALLKRIFFTNSSVLSGKDLTLRMNTGGVSGDGHFYISSLLPASNTFEAGATAPSGGYFSQSGGNITILNTGGPLSYKNVVFNSGKEAAAAGTGYALSPGAVTSISTKDHGACCPDSSGLNFVNVGKGSGDLYASASSKVPLPPRDLNASDVLAQVGAGPTTDTGGKTIPSTNPCFVPAGVWAFTSHNGNGDQIVVYNASGTIVNTFTGVVPCGTASYNAFNIKDYQLMVPPGVHLVVDSGQTAPVASPPGNAQGNLMLTLSPNDFASTNQDPQGGAPSASQPMAGKYVLPTLALGFQGANMLATSPSPLTGSQPSSLTLGGNLYVQGQVIGHGAIVSQTNSTAPAGWIPSGGSWPSGSSWASSVLISQKSPTSGDSGDLYIEGNSQRFRAPTYSLDLYAEGNARFNVIPSTGFSDTTDVTYPDRSAFASALNSFAQGSCSSGCSGGWWSGTIPNVGEALNGFLDYGHDPGKLTTVLRSAQNMGGPTGVNSAYTGISAVAIFGSGSTYDTTLASYFGYDYLPAPLPASPLKLYDYMRLTNYAQTGDASWLSSTLSQPASTSTAALDPIEMSIVGMVNQYAQQAAMGGSTVDFGTYFGGTTLAYGKTDLTFQGFLYAKGSGGFTAMPPQTRFGFQGAMVTSNGPYTIGDGLSNAGQANFIFDPNQFLNVYQFPVSGNPVTIQWMVVW